MFLVISECGKKKWNVRLFVWCAGIAVYGRLLVVSVRLLIVCSLCGDLLVVYGRLWSLSVLKTTIFQYNSFYTVQCVYLFGVRISVFDFWLCLLHSSVLRVELTLTEHTKFVNNHRRNCTRKPESQNRWWVRQ